MGQLCELKLESFESCPCWLKFQFDPLRFKVVKCLLVVGLHAMHPWWNLEVKIVLYFLVTCQLGSILLTIFS